MLASVDEIAVQGVEIKRILAQRFRHIGARLDILPDGVDELAHGRVFMPFADDVKRLCHGDTRSDHGRKLACKHGDIFGLNPLFDGEKR